MRITLNKIREYNPCIDGWRKLLDYLGKTQADDEPLAITTIIDSNGLNDALWCLRAVEGHDKELRLYAVWCARQVQHLLTDQRSLDALDVAERYANGQATDAELKAAWNAAWSAHDDAWAARAAARYAARSAAWEAARAAAPAAANAAEAARYAAWDAAWAAAADAAAAARDAAAAARDVAKAKQEAELRRICKEGE